MNWTLHRGLVFLIAATAHSLAWGALPKVYNVPPDIAPASIGAGDVLNVGVGGVIEEPFTAGVSSTVNVGGNLEFPRIHGELNVLDGLVYAIVEGGHIRQHGGTIGSDTALIDGTADIYDGVVSWTFYSIRSTVNVYGGEIESGTPRDAQRTGLRIGAFLNRQKPEFQGR